ncbi:hypothetical protein MMC18_005829 [Xylographa bjoerkii]|nr:hypothetical protein [Xylographa bjoerkii]
MHVDKFGEAFTKAAAAAYPDQGPSQYTAVKVLLLSWENAETMISTGIEMLQGVFQDDFGFKTETFEIPQAYPFKYLSLKLQGFREEPEEDQNNKVLRIVYYGGHSGTKKVDQCYWFLNDKSNSPEVNWTTFQKQLVDADPDILILLDCYNRGGGGNSIGDNIIEIIAATDSEVAVPAVRLYAFTSYLARELHSLSLAAPFSVAMLHQYVSSAVREEQLRASRMPTYASLAQKSDQRSIVLRGHRNMKQDFFMDELDCHKVLVFVELNGDLGLQEDDLSTQLENYPAFKKFARLQWLAPTDDLHFMSVMLIPIAIWDLLSKVQGVSFMQYVDLEALSNIVWDEEHLNA